jgi:cytochrome o ubiquinol oxidase subunit 2
MTFFFAYKYRATNEKAKYTPDWAHSTILEIVWWGIPCAIIIVLGTITWTSSHRLDPYKPLESKVKPITIQVIALDWKWLFIYPEENIATVNFIQFPDHVPINFKITADAPMNSFMIPQLGGQIYAMAGMQTKLHLLATEMGDYNGMSVSFSGPGFSGMKFIARVSSDADYHNWLNSVRASKESLTMGSYNKLAKPSEDNKVQYYGSVQNNLYNDVMMKFMMPMGEMNGMKNMKDMNGMKNMGESGDMNHMHHESM